MPNPFGRGSQEVAAASKPGEGPIRRLAITADQLVTQPGPGIEVIPDILSYAARTHGTENAMGWRDVVDIHEEEKEIKKTVDGKEVVEKKKWKYFQLSDYKYISYVELEKAVNDVALALVDLGISTEDVVNVYASTSVNWQFVAHACALISTTIATAYDTLGPEGLTHSLNQPSCVAIFTNADLLPTVVKVLPNTPSVRHVIYDGEPTPELLQKLRSIRPDSLQLHTITELRQRGQNYSIQLLASRRPNPDTLACIMYTSGSTGAPKGVCITHSNLIASVGSVKTLLGRHALHGDRFLAYLPLAHVLEYIVELCALYLGILIGYARNKTLTDTSVRNCVGDLSAFKPHIMPGVPMVWETIRKGIVGQVEKSGAVGKMVFHGALSVVKWKIPLLSWIVDKLVLGKVKQATGGELKFTFNGAAAISKETYEFISLTVAPMLQGYGMTETCGMCAILPPEFISLSNPSAGLPVPSVEVKFLDIPEAGYSSSNNPPTGEICIRGPSVIKGYFKRPDLNEDETIFTKDGWLRTGDVGRWNEDGTLSIIDRIKNLIKLQNGEYIALEQLESVYKSCNLVANVCVYADSNARQPIAIIHPHEHNLRAALSNSQKPATNGTSNGAPSASTSTNGSSDPSPLHTLSFHEICKSPAAKALVLKACNDVGKSQGLKPPAEMLMGVVLSDDEWTVENGLVTAALKIQRSKIAKVFEEEIKATYGH